MFPLVARSLTRGCLGFVRASYEALTSGRLEYHLKTEFPQKHLKLHDSNYKYTFSGNSWLLDFKNDSYDLDHDGKHVQLVASRQFDGTIHRSAHIDLPKRPDEDLPCPPFFAGSFWEKCTADFVRRNAAKAQIASENGGGIIIELEVPASELFAAFRSVSRDRLGHPGLLRLHVAPKFGYCLTRIEQICLIDSKKMAYKQFEASDFHRYPNDVWVPWKFSCSQYDDAGKVNFQVNYSILSADLINAKIPNTEFRVVLPGGTNFIDARNPGERDSRPHSLIHQLLFAD